MKQVQANANEAKNLLSVDCLVLRRGNTTVLNGVSLHINSGEIYGLLGPNGAGKSTAIAAITGLLPFTGGQIRVFGQDLIDSTQAVRRHIGVLPEDAGFYSWMTAPAYLTFYARLFDSNHSPDKIGGLLDLVGLDPSSRQLIGAFSRGMKQRLGLARALVADPRLLILDEPTNGLDPRGRRDIHDVLLHLAAEGVAILMCSHILDDIDRLCSAFGIIVKGETVASGTREDLLSKAAQGARYEIFLEAGDGKELAAVPGVTIASHEGNRVEVSLAAWHRPHETWARLLEAGWPVSEIRKYGTGLEDFYLSVTDTDINQERAA
ncbi:MAG: ABC transporter ATP-binding protein [Rhodobacteraceae bacterium]|nr:ABC transporter ATP-binding protein [Paracoccaceae bacterium]